MEHVVTYALFVLAALMVVGFVLAHCGVVVVLVDLSHEGPWGRRAVRTARIEKSHDQREIGLPRRSHHARCT